ncbi:cation transporter [Acidihalobacter prosperus]
MSCDCSQTSPRSQTERLIIRQALILNVLMCIIGLFASYYAESSSILADAIDMAADASGYALALLSVGGSDRLRLQAARWIGIVLIILGIGLIAETIQRWITGSDPFGPVMMVYSVLSFLVNFYVLRALAKIQEGGAHLKASYICTRADVLANIVVFVAGAIVFLTGIRWVDLLAGIAIAILVFSEAREILESAKESGSDKTR